MTFQTLPFCILESEVLVWIAEMEWKAFVVYMQADVVAGQLAHMLNV